jgi:Gpi18-like mannosyltransferase
MVILNVGFYFAVCKNSGLKIYENGCEKDMLKIGEKSWFHSKGRLRRTPCEELPRFPWLQKNLLPVTLAAVTVFAFLLRVCMYRFESYDFDAYLIKWYVQLQAGGGISALRQPLSGCNYTLSYLILLTPFIALHTSALAAVKSISIAADFLLAASCALLVHTVLEPDGTRRFRCAAVYTAVLLLPLTFIDSALWAQCDAIYTSFCVLAVYFLMRRKSLLACVMLGFAFAFKLQAVFLLPLIIFAFVSDRRFRLWHVAGIPAAVVLACIPALLVGSPVNMIYKPYGTQVGVCVSLDYCCPGVSTFLGKFPFAMFKNAQILFTMICMFAALVLLLHTRRRMEKSGLLLIGAWSSLFCVTFLPCMHDRYSFLPDILLLLLAFISRRKGDVICLLAEVAVSILSWMNFLGKGYTPVPMPVLALIRFGCVFWLTLRLWKELRFGDAPADSQEAGSFRFPWLNRHLLGIGLICITAFALAIRFLFYRFESGDFLGFLQKWYAQLEAGGGLPALRSSLPRFNSTLPYATLLAVLASLRLSALAAAKLLSVFADFVLAVGCALLLHAVMQPCRSRKYWCAVVYAAVLMIPETFLNSALWGQCDALYTALCIFSLYFLVKRNSFPACALLGFALAFKLQAIFLLPLFVFVLFTDRRFRLYHLASIPAAVILACLPAVLAGAPPRMIFQPYMTQIINSDKLSVNFPGAATFLNWLPFSLCRNMLVLFTMACLLTGLAAVLYMGRRFTPFQMLLLGAWSSLFCVSFLPCMRDRYAFLPDMLLLVLAFASRRKDDAICAAAETIVSLLSWLFYLEYPYQPIPLLVLALVRLSCVFWLTLRLWQELKKPAAGTTDVLSDGPAEQAPVLPHELAPHN